MRGRGRSSGGGSSGKSAPKETQKEKPNETPKESSSSDDSEDSGPPQILKKRTDKPASREILSADVAREEVESLLNEPPPKTIAQKKTGSAAPHTPSQERQRVLEQNRKDAAAAQKIADDQKEKTRLEEENKKLRAQLEKAKSVPDPIPESPRPKAAKKMRLSNTVRRVTAVNLAFHFIIRI